VDDLLQDDLGASPMDVDPDTFLSLSRVGTVGEETVPFPLNSIEGTGTPLEQSVRVGHEPPTGQGDLRWPNCQLRKTEASDKPDPARCWERLG
jgi:hypothetical protein